MAWFWHQCMSSGTLTEITVKGRLKLSHPKNKPYVNIIHKCHRVKAMHWGKVRNSSVVRQIKIWTFFFFKHGCSFLWVKVQKSHLGCYQDSVKNPSSLHQGLWTWQLAHLKPTLKSQSSRSRFSLCQIPVSYSLNGVQLWFSV